MRHTINSILLMTIIFGMVLWLTSPIQAQDTGTVTYSNCTADTKAGNTCLYMPLDVSPTQANVGAIQVQCKSYKFQNKSGSEMGDYLNEYDHHVPAIVGPDGKFYITDHHHMTTALWITQTKYQQHTSWRLRVDIMESYYDSGMTMDDFWAYMVSNNFAYLYNNGKAITWEQLPTNVAGLTDDPYRSQSGFQKNDGLYGYIKPANNAMFFLEFKWGGLMRDDKVLGDANSIPACSPDGEPWYTDGTPCASQATVQVNGLKGGYISVTSRAASPVMQPQCMDSNEGLTEMCGYNPEKKPNGKYPYPDGARITKKCNVKAAE